jgi:hypothetical protein
MRDSQQPEVVLKEINDLKAALGEHARVAITDPQGKSPMGKTPHGGRAPFLPIVDYDPKMVCFSQASLCGGNEIAVKNL